MRRTIKWKSLPAEERGALLHIPRVDGPDEQHTTQWIRIWDVDEAFEPDPEADRDSRVDPNPATSRFKNPG